MQFSLLRLFGYLSLASIVLASATASTAGLAWACAGLMLFIGVVIRMRRAPRECTFEYCKQELYSLLFGVYLGIVLGLLAVLPLQRTPLQAMALGVCAVIAAMVAFPELFQMHDVPGQRQSD